MIAQFIDLLFPRCCVVCNEPLMRGEHHISASCLHQLPKFDLSIPNESLLQRFYGISNIQNAVAYYKFAKKNSVQRIIHQIKYKNNQDLAVDMGKRFGLALKDSGVFDDLELLVSVPLHKTKLKRRGYNQAECIAIGMAQVLDIPHDGEIILRNTYSDSQTTMSRTQRFQNADNIYNLSRNVDLKDMNVLVVDDVITTGATIGTCANLLIAAGCQKVSVAALASPE